MERYKLVDARTDRAMDEHSRHMSVAVGRRMPAALAEACGNLIESATAELKNGNLEKALDFIEQLDCITVHYPTSPYLIFVYLIRAEIAYFNAQWKNLQEYCELGINLASRHQQYTDLGRFYRILLQLALYERHFEQALYYSRLALFLERKGKQLQPSFRQLCLLGELLALIGSGQLQEARQIIETNKANEKDDALSIVIAKLMREVFEQAYTVKTYAPVLITLLDEIWQMKQFNLVKMLAYFLVQQYPAYYKSAFTHYFTYFAITAPMHQKLEKLAYNDHLRAVYIAASLDEKMGIPSGESFRQLLDERFEQAQPAQYVTVVAFLIKVNEPDVLSRHLQVKYEVYKQIDRDLSGFYKEATRGKYDPTAFCALFVTDEPPNVEEIGDQCRHYLSQIELELEGRQIRYYFCGGASSRQRRDAGSVHALYQEANQSLYYAQVTKQPMVLFEREG